MKQINHKQSLLYESYDIHGSKEQLKGYRDILDAYCTSGRKVKILDLGGATGTFAYLCKSEYPECDIDVYVIDSVKYEQWNIEPFKSSVHYFCDSVENLPRLFENGTFDIVFANRVFHHFVDTSYRKTLRGIQRTMSAIHSLLKKNGILCIMDELCDGLLIDSSTSFLIYTLTSIKNPAMSRIILKMGAMSAGVGVCFLSEKMWNTFLQKSGFLIRDIKKSNIHKLKSIKRICLLNKRHTRDNFIFAVPR